jgi:hypothetical protein
MNPNGVTAAGTTLRANGWFCSRQFMADLQKAGWDESARAVGFKRIECAGGGETSWLDL